VRHTRRQGGRQADGGSGDDKELGEQHDGRSEYKMQLVGQSKGPGGTDSCSSRHRAKPSEVLSVGDSQCQFGELRRLHAPAVKLPCAVAAAAARRGAGRNYCRYTVMASLPAYM